MSRIYTQVGIDGYKDTHAQVAYGIAFRTYDFNGLVCEPKAGWVWEKHDGAGGSENNLRDVLEKYNDYLKSTLNKRCTRFNIYFGDKISQSDIVRMLFEAYPDRIRKQGRYIGNSVTVELDHDIRIVSRPKVFSSFDFRWSEEKSDLKECQNSEFEKFCDDIISQTSLADFLKRSTSARRQMNKILSLYNEDEEEDTSETSEYRKTNSAELILEYKSGLNTGGRLYCKNPFEEMRVMEFDINSMYSAVLCSESFTKSELHKIRPGELGLNYSDRGDLIKLRRTFDKVYGKAGWHCRVLLTVDRAILKDYRYGVNISTDAVVKMGGNVGKANGVATVLENAKFALHLYELIDFIKGYEFDGFRVVLLLLSRASRMSQEVRQKFYDLYNDARIAKEKNLSNRKALKVLKNNSYGYFAYSSPFKKIEKGMEDSFINLEDKKAVWAIYKEGRKSGSFANPLAGSEIPLRGRTLHRTIQTMFEKRGFEVVYGHTDSFYVKCPEGEESRLRLAALDINKILQKSFREKNKDLRLADVNIWSEIGCMKIEHKGEPILIKHAGMNQIFKFNATNGCLIDAAVSPINWHDLEERAGRSLNIDDFYEGATWERIPHKYEDGETRASRIVFKSWKFEKNQNEIDPSSIV